MTAEILHEEIIRTLKAATDPQLVDELLSRLKRSAGIEDDILQSQDRRGDSKQLREVLLVEQEHFDRLITMCEQKLPPDEQGTIFLRLAEVFKTYGELGRAEQVYSQMLKRSGGKQAKSQVAEAYLRRGEIFSLRGDWKRSASDLNRSKKLFLELKDRHAIGRVENILGAAYAERGRLKLAEKYFSHALREFDRTPRAPMAGVAYMNLGIVFNIEGMYDKALTQYKRAQSSFESTGDVKRLAELHHNIGMSYLFKGKYKEANGEFDVSYSFSSPANSVSLMGLSNLGKATARFYMNDLPVALQLARRAIEAFTNCEDRLSLADAYKVKGMIHRDMESYEEAETYLHTSLRLNAELGNKLNLGETYFEIGVLENRRKDPKKAIHAFQKGKACFQKIGAREELRKTIEQLNYLKGSNSGS